MTIKEKLLELIGLERMTNRDLILAELAEMDGAAFYDAFCDNKTAMATDDAKCADCHALHGGKCPRPGDDDPCALTDAAWLEMPATRERLIGVTGQCAVKRSGTRARKRSEGGGAA